MLVPLAAGLSGALKNRGYGYFTITSYKAPVCPPGTHPGEVALDATDKGGHYGERAATRPELIAIWR